MSDNQTERTINGTKCAAVESGGQCLGCAAYTGLFECEIDEEPLCTSDERDDGIDIVWHEVKERK